MGEAAPVRKRLNALPVRAPVGDGLGHRGEGLLEGPMAVAVENSSNSTHREGAYTSPEWKRHPKVE